MSIKDYLITDCDILEFDSLASTNDTAKELGIAGKRENTVIIAKAQTAGRGRLGRSFFSPESSGIYMSILLRPTVSPEDITLITPAAAVAVNEALAEICDTDTKIKWVNDIYKDNKKVCGILCESTFFDGGYFSVLGIGINLYSPKSDFPDEIKNIAGAVFDAPVDNEIHEELIAKIIDNFNFYYKNLTKKEFMSIYREKSNLIGKTVSFSMDKKEITGMVLDIDDNARLIVKVNENEVLSLFAGEVSVKITDLL